MSHKNNFVSLYLSLILFLLSLPVSAVDLLDFVNNSSEKNLENIVFEGNVGFELVSEEAFIVPNKPIQIGLRIIHDPEWHTYWINPGDSGLATKIKWEFSQVNSAWEVGPIQWPTPKRIFVGPLVNFGYENEVLLVQKIIAPSKLIEGTKIQLTADINWLICKEVCIPGFRRLAFELPVIKENEDRKFSKDSSLFKSFKLNQPVEKTYTSSINAAIDEDKNNLIFFQTSDYKNLDIVSFRPNDGFFFPLKEGLIRPSGDQVFYNLKKKKYSSSEGAKGWMLEVPLTEFPKESIQNVFLEKKIKGLFVNSNGKSEIWSANLVSGDDVPTKGTEIIFDGKEKLVSSDSTPIFEMASAIFFAFLGGLILNLMPCVFPIVSLKVLSITEGVKDKTSLVEHGLGFVSGVIFSVMAFAVFFIVFRELGYSVGWGLQLQSAWVVLGLSMLFVAIAMNLFGVFELGKSFTSLGVLDNRKGLIGAFFSGILTVVVASPCTAPFMGGAIGLAATANIFTVFLIFFALAIGISTPYFVLISQPNLVSKLPKPGEWMIKLRQFLAFPMLAAAGWLFWILIELNGSTAVFPGWLAILFICLTLWVWGGFFQSSSTKLSDKKLISLMLLLFFSLSLFFFYLSVNSQNIELSTKQSINQKNIDDLAGVDENFVKWLPWSEKIVKDSVDKGLVVFIDFTASWCVICQTNKIRVLNTNLVKNKLSQDGIIALRADWTNSDDEITKALSSYGRIGIPLNVILGPNLKEPIILSEWLTIDELLKAISIAKK